MSLINRTTILFAIVVLLIAWGVFIFSAQLTGNTIVVEDSSRSGFSFGMVVFPLAIVALSALCYFKRKN